MLENVHAIMLKESMANQLGGKDSLKKHRKSVLSIYTILLIVILREQLYTLEKQNVTHYQTLSQITQTKLLNVSNQKIAHQKTQKTVYFLIQVITKARMVISLKLLPKKLVPSCQSVILLYLKGNMIIQKMLKLKINAWLCKRNARKCLLIHRMERTNTTALEDMGYKTS